jgi:hypothetical protein
MKNLCSLLLVGWLLAPAAGGAQTVLGRVSEEGTRVPIAGALLELVAADARPSIQGQTDPRGLFLFRLPRPGIYVIRVAHPSYQPVTSDTLRVRPDETVEVEIRMSADAIPLAPVVVRARRPGRLAGFYERMEQPGHARFVKRSDIERRPGASATDLLRDIPGISIRRVGRGGGAPDPMITMQAGGCMPVIYIDGMEFRQAPGSGVDGLIRPDVLEGVEVYRGLAGVPQGFVSNGCGVVAFWTRTAEPGAPFTWRRVFQGAAVLLAMVAFVLTTR